MARGGEPDGTWRIQRGFSQVLVVVDTFSKPMVSARHSSRSGMRLAFVFHLALRSRLG